jgi:hypothetical protein
VLRASGGEQQGFGAVIEPGVLWIQDQRSDGLCRRCATWLARVHNCAPATGQMLSEQPCLGRFSGTIGPLKDDEHDLLAA